MSISDEMEARCPQCGKPMKADGRPYCSADCFNQAEPPDGPGSPPIVSNFAERVRAELAGARQLHRAMAGPHEAYAVILEELEEFWEGVKHDHYKTAVGRTAMVDELVQIAAMCQRAAEDVFPTALSYRR